MPRINGVASDRVQSAVAFSIKCPNATIPQCMLACGFLKQEANDRAKRMAIYRHLKKVSKPKQGDTNEYVTPATLAVDVPVLNESGALSSVTVSLSDIIVPGEEDAPIPVNLDTMVSERIVAGQSLPLQPKLVGLPVFGGEDRCMIPVRTFQAGFLRERCVDAWAKIGAATSTGEIMRACLSDKQVMQEVGDIDSDDDKDCLCWKVKTANTHAVDALVRTGYDGELLRATLKQKREEERPITQPRPKQRQIRRQIQIQIQGQRTRQGQR